MESLFGRYSFMMFKGDEKNCIHPFNRSEYFEEIDITDSILNTSLLQKVKPGSKMNAGVGMYRGIAKIVIPTIYPDIKNFGGYGKTKDGETIVDYWGGEANEFNEQIEQNGVDQTLKNNRHTLLKMSKTECKIVCVDEFGSESTFITQTKQNQKNTHSPAAFVTLLLAYFICNRDSLSDEITQTVVKHFDELINNIQIDNIDVAKKYAIALTNDLYCIMKYDQETSIAFGGLPFEIKMFTNDYSKFKYNEIKVDSFTGSSPYFDGSVNPFDGNINTNKINVLKRVKDLVESKEYDLGVEWPESEKALIPDDAGNIVLSEVAQRSLDALKATWKTEMKFWSYCWYGPSGTGKSTDARALAQVLGFPYYPQALSDNSYADDILVSKTANTSQMSKADYFAELAKYPTVAQAAKNVEDAWYKLVGTKKQGVKIEEYERALNLKMYSLAENVKTFKEVPSPLFMAYTQGGVCELVEANAMKPAQAKILNSMLDDTAKIYIDGKVYHRHPNFILIATMNCDEGTEGVHTLSRDFVQRFQIGEMYKGISDEAIKERIKRKTLLKDDAIISRMIKVYRSMEKVCIEDGDSHDFVGLRQLYNWAQLTAVTNMPYQSGLSTMVGLGTFNEDMAEELKSSLKTQFNKFEDNSQEIKS